MVQEKNLKVGQTEVRISVVALGLGKTLFETEFPLS